MDSLDLKNSKSVLIFLAEVDVAKKSDLFHIVKSHQVLDRLLEALTHDGYLVYEYNKVGPKKNTISLTAKGRQVAEQLMRTDEIAKGKKLRLPDRYVILEFINDHGPVTVKDLDDHFLGSNGILRELEAVGALRQEIDNSTYPPTNKLTLTEKGKKAAKKLREAEEILNG